MCINQHPWLTDEREAKWSETWGIEHLCQKHLSEKLSTVPLLCNAHSFPVVSDWAFWVLFSSPRYLTPTCPPFSPLLLWRFSSCFSRQAQMHICWDFGPVVKRGLSRRQATEGTWQEERCCELWAPTQHSVLFVLFGMISSTLRSFGWGVLRCVFLMDSLISVNVELTLEWFFFQLCYSSIHHSDSFCPLTYWDVKVSCPLCPAWLDSQSASSEATHGQGEGLEPDSFIRFF